MSDTPWGSDGLYFYVTVYLSWHKIHGDLPMTSVAKSILYNSALKLDDTSLETLDVAGLEVSDVNWMKIWWNMSRNSQIKKGSSCWMTPLDFEPIQFFQWFLQNVVNADISLVSNIHDKINKTFYHFIKKIIKKLFLSKF